jgi:hypothetical protein
VREPPPRHGKWHRPSQAAARVAASRRWPPPPPTMESARAQRATLTLRIGTWRPASSERRPGGRGCTHRACWTRLRATCSCVKVGGSSPCNKRMLFKRHGARLPPKLRPTPQSRARALPGLVPPRGWCRHRVALHGSRICRPFRLCPPLSLVAHALDVEPPPSQSSAGAFAIRRPPRRGRAGSRAHGLQLLRCAAHGLCDSSGV